MINVPNRRGWSEHIWDLVNEVVLASNGIASKNIANLIIGGMSGGRESLNIKFWKVKYLSSPVGVFYFCKVFFFLGPIYTAVGGRYNLPCCLFARQLHSNWRTISDRLANTFECPALASAGQLEEPSTHQPQPAHPILLLEGSANWPVLSRAGWCWRYDNWLPSQFTRVDV